MPPFYSANSIIPIHSFSAAMITLGFSRLWIQLSKAVTTLGRQRSLQKYTARLTSRQNHLSGSISSAFCNSSFPVKQAHWLHSQSFLQKKEAVAGCHTTVSNFGHQQPLTGNHAYIMFFLQKWVYENEQTPPNVSSSSLFMEAAFLWGLE